MEGDWYLCQAAIAVDGEDVKVQMKDQSFLLNQERDNTTGGSSTRGTHTAGMTGGSSTRGTHTAGMTGGSSTRGTHTAGMTGGSSTRGTHTAGMTGEESCLEWRGLGGYYTKVSSN